MYVTRMKAYEGDEDYIFVSYAHKDADFVLPIIDNLHELGYRVWFDEGIEASAEWPEYIEDHMNRCSAVLADTGRKYNIDYEVDYKGVIINKAD